MDEGETAENGNNNNFINQLPFLFSLDDQNLRKMRDRRATYPNFQVPLYLILASTSVEWWQEDNELDKPKGKQILIQLQTLHPKDIFVCCL